MMSPAQVPKSGLPARWNFGVELGGLAHLHRLDAALLQRLRV